MIITIQCILWVSFVCIDVWSNLWWHLPSNKLLGTIDVAVPEYANYNAMRLGAKLLFILEQEQLQADKLGLYLKMLAVLNKIKFNWVTAKEWC